MYKFCSNNALYSWSLSFLSDRSWTQTHNHLVHKRTQVWNNWPKYWVVLWVLISTATWWKHTLKCTVQVSTHNTVQLFGQLGRIGVFVYELSGCGFESSCSHLNFRFRTSFEQGVPWNSGNSRVWIHSKARTWSDENLQPNAPHRYVLRTQLNHLTSWAKWLSVCLWT